MGVHGLSPVDIGTHPVQITRGTIYSGQWQVTPETPPPQAGRSAGAPDHDPGNHSIFHDGHLLIAFFADMELGTGCTSWPCLPPALLPLQEWMRYAAWAQ